VFIMPAGIAGWEKAKKPVEKGTRQASNDPASSPARLATQA